MVSGATTVDELLSMCSADALGDLASGELAGLATEFLALWSRLEAARLRVIAAAATAGAYHLSGARDMASWLAAHAGDRRGAARRDVELAVNAAAMPAVADGLADGSLTKAQAVELTRAVDAPAAVQAELVAAAVSLTPEEVGRRVDRWHLDHGDTLLAPSLRTTPVAGGGRIDARLDGEGFEWVQIAIDTAARQLAADDTWAERRARGLVGICRYFLDHADVPSTRLGRPTVVVTIDIDTLAAATGGTATSGTATLASGTPVPAAVARRLSCHADLVRLVTGPASQPLDVGRRRRTPSSAQCRAVIHRDRHCRYDGCHAPPWACEVHHLDHWARGGRTDLKRLALLCWHHHTLTHRHTDHELSEIGEGTLALRPRRRTARPDAA